MSPKLRCYGSGRQRQHYGAEVASAEEARQAIGQWRSQMHDYWESKVRHVVFGGNAGTSA